MCFFYLHYFFISVLLRFCVYLKLAGYASNNNSSLSKREGVKRVSFLRFCFFCTKENIVNNSTFFVLKRESLKNIKLIQEENVQDSLIRKYEEGEMKIISHSGCFLLSSKLHEPDSGGRGPEPLTKLNKCSNRLF